MIRWLPKSPSKIALVGEAPGEQERLQGFPFVGPEGKYLTKMLKAAGITKSEIYVTNVVHQQPPKNNFDRLPAQVIEDGKAQLQQDLEEWQPNLVIACGAKALEALTGRTKIFGYRGAVIESTLVPGQKVLPTLHPGNLIKGNPAYEPIVIRDLGKAREEAKFPEIHHPQRDVEIVADINHAISVLNFLTDISSPVACDIECYSLSGQMTAYGIATSRNFAYSITKEALKSPSVLRALSEFCDSSTPKIFHNGLFDVLHNALYYNIHNRNWHDDTMIRQHAIMPIYEKSLAFCASIYTSEPYWKCLKGDCEVLTPIGWKRLDSIFDKENIMVSDFNGNLSFERVNKMSYLFAGYGVRIKTLRHDCWYTGNHRILREDMHGSIRNVVEAENLRGRFNLVSAGKFVEGNVRCDFMRLLVAIQADGSVKDNIETTVYFRLAKERKIERLREICDSLGITMVFLNSSDPNMFNIGVKGWAVEEATNLLGDNKDFGSYLLNFDYSTLETFLQELVHWDGWITYGGSALNYSSTNWNNIEWVKTIAHCCGYTAHVMQASGERWKNCKKISIRDTDKITVKPHQIEKEWYEGDVHCVNTSTGYFLCKSNGQIFITGNSELKDAMSQFNSSDGVDWEAVYRYNGKDCCLTYEIYEEQEAQLDYWQTHSIHQHMLELLHPCLRAMYTGFRVDMSRVNEFAEENEAAIRTLERICEETIGEFNPKSDKQKQDLLYHQWKMPRQHKKGKLTADRNALERLERFPTPYKPHIGLIRTMMDFYKRRDFYRLKMDDDERIRYALKITGTYTGRMSSSKSITGSGMNYQNQPKRVRQFYVADPGKIFINMDLSQVEARIVAALCHDEQWLREFDEEDLHTKVAMMLYNIPCEQVRKEFERQASKRVGHAAHYMLGDDHLSKILQCSIKHARGLRLQYFNVRPKLESWHDWVRDKIKKDKMLRTAFGRVIQFPGRVDDSVVRKAVAAEPQSTAGDYLNYAIRQMDQHGPEDFGFQLQVHDSILWQVDDKPENVIRNIQAMKELAEVEINVRGVPLVVPTEYEFGYDWKNMLEIEADTSRETIEKTYEKLQCNTANS